jgi:hypothetical protein
MCALAAMPAMALAVTARAADKPVARPWVTFSLPSLGVPSIPPQFFEQGMSMLTVDFVDNSHLLLTFGTRGLIPRLPGDPPGDDDRMVAAELVELPSGHIVARTDWHLHDHGRYLWRLGNGRFLVRSRDTLFALTPRALLHEANPLASIAFPQRTGWPAAALLSPDASLVMVETVLPTAATLSGPLPQASTTGSMTGPAPPARAQAASDDDADPDKPIQVSIDFYRLSGGDTPEAPFTVSGAGVVRAPTFLAIPIDHDGYLWPGDPNRDRWPLSFNEYSGKELAVGAVDSTCVPRLQMVSAFEFVAFACQGSDDRLKLQAFGMDGHEMWEEGFGSAYGQPVFAFAPAAGRFAMSRISSMVTDPGPESAIPGDAEQEVRVYQTESGDLLLRVASTPVMRNAENFDLSPDGRLAAVVTGGAVQVYKLPAPSARDMKDLQEAASLAPPVSDGMVRLTRLVMPAADSATVGSAAAATPAGPAAPAPAAVPAAGVPAVGAVAAGTGGAPVGGAAKMETASSAAGSGAVAAPAPVQASVGDSGDSAEGAPRKPPTLLEPGETPEFKGAKTKTPQ